MAYADIFAILCLLSNTLVVIFLIISAVYFYNVSAFTIPSSGQSTFMFATALVLAFICLVLGMYAVWQIFSYRPLTVVETTAINTANAPIQNTITGNVVTTQTPMVTVAPVSTGNSIPKWTGTPLSDVPTVITNPQNYV